MYIAVHSRIGWGVFKTKPYTLKKRKDDSALPATSRARFELSESV